MSFNTSQAFKRLSSSAGARAIGGIPAAKSRAETYLANAGLGAIANYEAAKLGADTVRYQGDKAAGATMFGAWTGAIGNVLGAGLSAGIKNWQSNQGLGKQPTYEQAAADANQYDYGTDAGYGGQWTGGGTPRREDYRPFTWN